MSGSVNKVILVGNLGRDPEIRATQNGNRIANLSVATAESWRDKHSGERKEQVEWHKVAIFNDGLVGVVDKYLKKGSKVYIEGALQTRKWTGKDGKDNYSTEVVLQAYNGVLKMLDGASGGGAERGETSRPKGIDPYAPGLGSTPSANGSGRRDELDDDIPF